MEGWIIIHRSIQNHWIWKNYFYARRWQDLIFLAQWKDSDVDLGKRTIHLKRGQFLTSTRQLMALWHTNTTTVLDFLRVLEKNEMITRKRSGNVSIITICNYDKYQLAPMRSYMEAKSDPKMHPNPPVNQSENSFPKTPPESSKSYGRKQDHGVTNAVPSEENNNINNNSLSLSEREEKILEEAKASQSYIEIVAKNHLISIEETLKNLDIFFGYISAVQHWHNDASDFKDHFYKWLTKKLETSIQNENRKQRPKGHTQAHDKYKARRGTDVGDKTASDYGGSF